MPILAFLRAAFIWLPARGFLQGEAAQCVGISPIHPLHLVSQRREKYRGNDKLLAVLGLERHALPAVPRRVVGASGEGGR
jgi:hypothetical protein